MVLIWLTLLHGLIWLPQVYGLDLVMTDQATLHGLDLVTISAWH
jgi:hypothetical protein